MQAWTVVAVAIVYLLALFVVAWAGDRRARWARRSKRSTAARARPVTYTLSLAVYCTSWTFFGSVGLASTQGFDFLGIYLGPVLAITFGYPLMARIVRTAKAERITSIADFLAARYGKSASVGAVAALIALLGTVPYVALQLIAVSNSVTTAVAYYLPPGSVAAPAGDTGLAVALLLALFAVLFGTRHADATEHQDGMLLAVAAESVVKLVAFLGVGVFVVFFMFDGPSALADAARTAEFRLTLDPLTFATFTLLSFFAFLFLPRQFHVAVVENRSLSDLRTARWGFPLYLVAINLFVLPVAAAGVVTFGGNVDADAFVLALPLREGAGPVAALAFLGGLSAATAMAIVASVALAIMVSNNLVLPLVLRRDAATGRARGERGALVLAIRRIAIAGTFALAYAYAQSAGGTAALASIGLLSFAAIAQFAPAMLIGLVWRRATARGAILGLMTGFGVWLYTLFVPTLLAAESTLLLAGPFGIDWLRPRALFGVDLPPLLHGVAFSLLANVLALLAGTFSRTVLPLERVQARQFIPSERRATIETDDTDLDVTRGALEVMVSRYLGRERTRRSFEAHLDSRGVDMPSGARADTDLIRFSEQLLASAIGTASARLVVSLLVQSHENASLATRQLLDEAARAVQDNSDLLRTALDRVDQGFAVFDADYRLSAWNRRFRTALDLPAPLGRIGTPIAEFARAVEPHLEPPVDLTRLLIGPPRTVTVFHRPTGTHIEIETRPLPEGGHVVSWNDVSQRVAAQAVLERDKEDLERSVAERTQELTRLAADLDRARAAAEAANASKTQFLAAAGHDILQPLNAARLYASALSERGRGGGDTDLPRRIDRSLRSVEEILGAVLEISRLDSAAWEPSRATFRVRDTLERLAVEFEPAAKAKGLDLRIGPDAHHVRTDAALLYRALQNLVSNAIRYTAQGSVTVETRAENDRLVFAVRDTGHGIAAADRERIFAEFARLDDGRRASEGFGLGLSIVRRIADVLDHPLDFTSGPGGTTFTLSAPLAETPARSTHHRRQAAVTSNVASLRVVCIDNDPAILDGMNALLSGWGVHVATAASPETVLAPFDAIVSDYHLDDADGLDAIETLRAGRNVPAVLLTADRSTAVSDRATAAGVTVLRKPLKPARLRAWLATVAAGLKAEA